MRNRLYVPTVLVLIAGLLWASVPVRGQLLAERKKSGLAVLELSKLPPVGAASLLLLGGFRGIAVDVLWLRVHTLHVKRQYDEEIGLIELISRLQPHYVSVWVFQGWNIAFNISVQYPRVEDQWTFVKYGIGFVKRGLALNPDNPDLLFYLGYLYSEKVHQNDYFERAMEREMGVNNFEEAARFYDRARHSPDRVTTFHPRVVDVSVYYCYYLRIMQILKRAEVTDDLEFDPGTRQEVEAFLALCRKETAGLRERWTRLVDGRLLPEETIEMQPIRNDLVWFDGYVLQAEKTLYVGDFTDASIARAEQLLARAWPILERRVMHFDPANLAADAALAASGLPTPAALVYDTQRVRDVYRQVVENKIADAAGRIPYALVMHAQGLISQVQQRPEAYREAHHRGVELLERALAMCRRAADDDFGSRDVNMLIRQLPEIIAQEKQRKLPGADDDVRVPRNPS